jgi:hypothetical protein
MGRITGDVTVPGTEKDQSVYRSELAGIYSLLICVKHICDFFNIHSVSIELIGCDGQSALDKAFNHVSIIRIEDPANNILFAICPYGPTHLLTGSFGMLKATKTTTLVLQIWTDGLSLISKWTPGQRSIWPVPNAPLGITGLQQSHGLSGFMEES